MGRISLWSVPLLGRVSSLLEDSIQKENVLGECRSKENNVQCGKWSSQERKKLHYYVVKRLAGKCGESGEF